MTTTAARLRTMLEEVTVAFHDRGIVHALAGGMAMAAHNITRATKDIDFLVSNADARAAADVLQRLGYAPASEEGAGFARFVRRPLPELPGLTEWVDLLLARQAIGLELLEEAQRQPLQWDGLKLAVVSREGLAAMKLLALSANPSRITDYTDIRALLESDKPLDSARVRSLARELGADVVELFDAIARQSSDGIRDPRFPFARGL